MRCLRGCEVRSLRGSKLGVRWLDNGIGLRECEIRSSRVRQFHGIGDDDSRCLDKAAACNTYWLNPMVPYLIVALSLCRSSLFYYPASHACIVGL